jgi:hypothetical protein
VFGDICEQVGPNLDGIKDLASFHKYQASNLTFEDTRYMFDLDYGKQVLALICSKIKDISKSCWGYENNCQQIHLMPECQRTDMSRTIDKQEQMITWFNQVDFGYILERVRELNKYCVAEKRADLSETSSFECTKHFTTCRGNNLYARINISALSNPRTHDDSTDHSKVFTQLGGWGCDLQKARINEEADLSGRLESWYEELKGYARVDNLKTTENCDFVENRQVFFVKINSTNNLDSYLSTFINLYATIHMNNRFSDDNQIIIWDKHLPRSKTFEHLWYAFSRFPPASVGQMDGRTFCFKKFVFAMPPNMIDGLHTDKPLVDGCSKSGLYNAFHKHVVHRLRLQNKYDLQYHRETQGKKTRIVILSRASRSEFRNILNEKALEETLRKQTADFEVRVLKYNSMDFHHVLTETLNSDIMIGLHSTGLAYSLFLPDWAGLIELHDCSKDRYEKLARLRGISYFKPTKEQIQQGFVTKIRIDENSKDWSYLNQSRLLDHDEFSNYEVNVKQFMELFNRAHERVLRNREEYFKQFETHEPEVAEQPAVHQDAATESPPSSTVRPTEDTSTSTTTVAPSTATMPSTDTPVTPIAPSNSEASTAEVVKPGPTTEAAPSIEATQADEVRMTSDATSSQETSTAKTPTPPTKKKSWHNQLKTPKRDKPEESTHNEL